MVSIDASQPEHTERTSSDIKLIVDDVLLACRKNAPVNIHALARAFGFDILLRTFKQPISGERINAFTDGNLIYLNATLTPVEAFYVIAHELGHYFLNRKWLNDDARYTSCVTPMPNSKEQREAKLFAMHALVPMEILERYVDIASTQELKTLFCVNDEIIRMAIEYLKKGNNDVR